MKSVQSVDLSPTATSHPKANFHLWPFFPPDFNHLLYFVAFVSGGLLYVRDRSLMAQPFHPKPLLIFQSAANADDAT